MLRGKPEARCSASRKAATEERQENICVLFLSDWTFIMPTARAVRRPISNRIPIIRGRVIFPSGAELMAAPKAERVLDML